MKKLVSMLLAIVMMTNMFVAGAYSVENVTSSVDSGSYQLDEHVSLEIETDQEGVVTISQYNDGVLVETVVSDPNNPDSILSTTYENENPVGTEIDISDVKVFAIRIRKKMVYSFTVLELWGRFVTIQSRGYRR